MKATAIQHVGHSFPQGKVVGEQKTKNKFNNIKVVGMKVLMIVGIILAGISFPALLILDASQPEVVRSYSTGEVVKITNSEGKEISLASPEAQKILKGTYQLVNVQ
jgi:hypothetical protein